MSFSVSIIIPAFNAEKFIAETIRSALNQTYPAIEIIVVDDGSSDQTYTIAKQFEQEGIRVFSQLNRGAAAARNRGIDESTGNYIQFLDADDLLAPSKIEEQMNIIEKDGDEYVYAGKWKIFYKQISENNLFMFNDLWKSFDDPADWLITAWTKQVWMHPSVWLTPRSLIKNAGPWDESLSLHDDGEFFCRVLLQSKGVRFCEESVSYYRKGINDSLSSIVSSRAVQSHFRICGLYEQHLLKYKNSAVSRKACACNYLSFYYDHYPGNGALRQKALKEVERLGGSDIEPSGTDLFNLLRKVFGWRMAKIMERLYYSNSLNRRSIKKLQ